MSDEAPPLLCWGLPYDGIAAFIARFLRMFNYGAISPVFYLYLTRIGFSTLQVGSLLTAILCGDLLITLWLSTRADRFGRRATLVIASLLKILASVARDCVMRVPCLIYDMLQAGVAFAFSESFYVLVAAGVIGVISTSGGEIGPFIAIEQACPAPRCCPCHVPLSSARASRCVWEESLWSHPLTPPSPGLTDAVTRVLSPSEEPKQKAGAIAKLLAW